MTEKSNFNIDEWLDLLMNKLLAAYGERLLFAGHVGSWVRGEAGPESDIDVNVILDTVKPDDVKAYKKIIAEMPDNSKACGFICSKDEILAWPAHEIFHFANGCKIMHGDFPDSIKNPGKKEISDYIKISTSAIIHEARHRMIYSNDIKKEVNELKMAYKSCFFILQAWISLKSGEYIPTKKEMLAFLKDENDREILTINMAWDSLESDRAARPEYYFNIIDKWCSDKLLKS